ncbi:MAG TPA: glutamate--tRNA ligase [Rhizomicrobium sp.]|jgi:glutamyl-tRNA synthetase|nr:glutamate--tRNA ligase [Rhizomicrobium sp.]
MSASGNKIIVRFAPSPTGLLHVGNARTALLNYLFARKRGGKFLLRIDDTDAARSKKEFEEAIYRDLDWLGITHDLTDRQLGRLKIYSTAFYRLQAKARVYPCYETEAELERQRALLKLRKLPPIYDRAALKLTESQRAAFEAEGRKPHWRFKLSRSRVAWSDLVRGPVEIDTATMSDPVLVREDGAFLYTLPSVADDIDYAISHVVRGEDHVTNTAAQIEIFEALDAAVPAFAHFPLLVGAGGEALSKRLGSLSLESLREDGMEPVAVAAYLAKIGTSDAIEPRLSLDELAMEFDFAKIGRAPAHFDPAELAALNARTLHQMPYDLHRLGPMGVSETLWNAIRPNLSKLSDARDLALLVTGPVTPVLEDSDLAAKAAALLPPEPWDEGTWPAWTGAISAQTGIKGRGLFHPLRLALTGRGDGPELKKLLPLIGRARTLARLEGNTA